MKWARREVLAGDLALMAWMDSVLGTSSISDVRLDVTSTSYGRSHSGRPASYHTTSCASRGIQRQRHQRASDT